MADPVVTDPVMARPRPRKPGRAILVAVLLVVIAAGALAWRSSSPQVFAGCDTCSFTSAPIPASEFPFVAGMAKNVKVDGNETVTLDRAVLRYSQDDARMTTTFVVCTRRPVDSGTLTLGMIALADGSLDEYCTRVRPLVEGTTMRAGPDADEYLIALMRPSGSGTTRVSGLDLTYSRGWDKAYQSGTQHLKQNLTVVVE